MTAWPTLSQTAELDGYRRYTNDPTIRSATVTGISLDRPGVEEVITYIECNLRMLVLADVTALETFQGTTVKFGGLPFDFTDPVRGDTLSVRLNAPLEFRLDGRVDRWRTQVRLKENVS